MPTSPTILPVVIAAGDHNTIPVAPQSGGYASLTDGFPAITEQPIAAGGLPPQRGDFNGFLNLISEHLLWLQSGGLAVWNPTLDYPVPSMVVGSNGKLYLALQDSGPSGDGSKNPTTSPTYWQDYADSIFSVAGVAYLNVAQAWTRSQHPAQVPRTGQSGAQAVDLDLHQALAITATGGITISTPEHMEAERECTLRFYSSGAQTIGWASEWHGTSLVALPTTTVAGKWMSLSFVCLGSYMVLQGMSVEA